MIQTAIIYNHRGRFSKDGTAPVEVRVTVGRKPYYINTGVSVRPREWKFGQIVNRQDCDTLNERVQIMLERVDRIINEYLSNKNEHDIDFDEVRRMVRSPDGRRRIRDAEDMVAWMESQIPLLCFLVSLIKTAELSHVIVRCKSFLFTRSHHFDCLHHRHTRSI